MASALGLSQGSELGEYETGEGHVSEELDEDYLATLQESAMRVIQQHQRARALLTKNIRSPQPPSA